jgi:hypothetical protein
VSTDNRFTKLPNGWARLTLGGQVHYSLGRWRVRRSGRKWVASDSVGPSFGGFGHFIRTTRADAFAVAEGMMTPGDLATAKSATPLDAHLIGETQFTKPDSGVGTP